MKIALLGYGKMGKEIETAALTRGHEITVKMNRTNAGSITDEMLVKADVAIEFSTPHTVTANVGRCLNIGLPVVIGTTGWYDQFEKVKALCAEKNGTLFHATNFSLGVNLFFKLN